MRHAIAGLLVACVLGLTVLGTMPAHAAAPASSALSVGERARLRAGAMVSRPLRFDHDGGHYVGGVSYQIVQARPEAILAALSDVSNWPQALPRTKSARLLDSAKGISRVELVQGSSLVEARYTVMLKRAEDGETIRFWLDPSRPHDVKDVWGYFRVQALSEGRALITVGAALDLGSGIARLLFEDKIASMMLQAPLKIRDFVEPRALALAPSSTVR